MAGETQAVLPSTFKGIAFGNNEITNMYYGVREPIPVPVTFSYTGADQTYTAPKTGSYTIECRGAGSIDSKGGYAKGVVQLTAGTVLKVMVGQNGGTTSGTTYGFGGSSNTGTTKAGGGLSGVFTGSGTISASDSSRALVIGGGAGSGGGVRGAGGYGGGEKGADGVADGYGTIGSGGSQTGHGSSGNKGANQFNGGDGSGTCGYGGGGGWWGGNGCIGDTSVDDDVGAGGGSGYVISSAEDRVLTQGGGSAVNTHGKVVISYPGEETQIVGKPIKEVWSGGTKIRPYTPSKNYVLYDETYFQNSTSGSSGTISTKNGKLARTSYSFGGGNGNFSYTTMDGYPCAKVQPSHGNHHVGILDAAYNDVYANYKYLKIVCDYLRIDTSSASYGGGIESGTGEQIRYLNGWQKGASQINWASLDITSGAKYIFEQEIDLTNNSSTVTLTNIDTGAKQTTPAYTKQWARETSSTYIIQNGYKVLGIVSDQSCTIYEGNVYVYVSK